MAFDPQFNLDPARLNPGHDYGDMFLKGFAGIGDSYQGQVNKNRDYAAKLRELQDRKDIAAQESDWRKLEAQRLQGNFDAELALNKRKEDWDELHPTATSVSQWEEVPDPDHPGKTKLVGKTGGLYDEKKIEAMTKAKLRAPGSRPLGPTAADMVKDSGSSLTNTTFSLNTWKPEYGGHFWTGGDADMSLAQKGLPSFNTTPEQVSWWQSYRGYVSAIRKNKLYGAALSPAEQASFDSFEVQPTMDSKLIEENLKKQADIVKKAATTVIGNLIAGGADPTAVEQQLGVRIDDLGFKVKREDPVNKAKITEVTEFPIVEGLESIGASGIHGNEPTVDLGPIGG